MSKDAFYTYMVECADGSLYTGWTMDLVQRVAKHNGEIPGGAKYTRARRPVKLVWYTSFQRKQDAQSMEYQVKRMPRDQKRALVVAFAKAHPEAIEQLMTEAKSGSEMGQKSEGNLGE